MTSAEFLRVQTLQNLKSMTAAEEKELYGLRKRMASESMPAPQKGANGNAGTPPDKF